MTHLTQGGPTFPQESRSALRAAFLAKVVLPLWRKKGPSDWTGPFLWVFTSMGFYFSWKESHSVPLQLVGLPSQQPTRIWLREQAFWAEWWTQLSTVQ
jgi:hypothetical protein